MNRTRIGIIGAGPAGLSAALWLCNRGFAPWIVEAGERPGGMLNLNFLGNDWVLGHEDATGVELAQRFAQHVQRRDVRLWCGARPHAVRRDGGGFRLEFTTPEGAREETAQALLIATGTRYRAEEVLSGVPGAQDLLAREIACGPYAFADLEAQSGRRILIVGGGDNAYENARLLAGKAAVLHLVMRGAPRAGMHLRAEVEAAVRAGRCRVYRHTRIAAIARRDGTLEVRLSGERGSETVAVDRIHVLAGYVPNTAFLAPVFGALAAGFELDAAGYLRADADGRTGVRGVYAAGDVCNPQFPCVVSALAQGARAARAIEHDLALARHAGPGPAL